MSGDFTPKKDACNEELNRLHDIGSSQNVIFYCIELQQPGNINSCRLKWMNKGRLDYLGLNLPDLEAMGFDFFRQYIYPDDLKIMNNTLLRLQSNPSTFNLGICYRTIDRFSRTNVWHYAQVSRMNYFLGGAVREVLVNAFELPTDPTIIDQINNIFSISDNNELRLLFQSLTCHQKKILTYIIRGYTDTEIASEMNLRFNTIRTLHSRILKKIGVSKSRELITLAMLSGEYKDIFLNRRFPLVAR